MFPHFHSIKPKEPINHIKKLFNRQGKLADYLKDKQKDSVLPLDKDKIISEALKNVHYDKDEKVELEEVKNAVK